MDVSPSDLAVLVTMSQDRLRTIHASKLFLTEPALAPFISASSGLCELNLSGFKYFQENTEILRLKNLKVLDLSRSNIHGSTLQSALISSTKLLWLNVSECTNLDTRHLILENHPLSNLLDLDCRGVEMSIPLPQLHDAYPSLLSLNGTATALGTRMLHLHEFRFSWRIGERNTDKQSDIQQLSSDVIDLTGNVDGTSNNHCCTLFQSGLVLCAVQEFFGCNTCSIPNNRFVCLNCARTCHRGHDVYSVGTCDGSCDCCIFFPCQSFGDSECGTKQES